MQKGLLSLAIAALCVCAWGADAPDANAQRGARMPVSPKAAAAQQEVRASAPVQVPEMDARGILASLAIGVGCLTLIERRSRSYR